MSQLGYDTTSNLFYIKNIPSPTSATEIATTTTSANAATVPKPSSC